MNATEQQRLGIAIEAALAHAGVAVERPVLEGSKISHWRDVPGAALLAAFLQKGWRVVECEPPATVTGPTHERRHGPLGIVR